MIISCYNRKVSSPSEKKLSNFIVYNFTKQFVIANSVVYMIMFTRYRGYRRIPRQFLGIHLFATWLSTLNTRGAIEPVFLAEVVNKSLPVHLLEDAPDLNSHPGAQKFCQDTGLDIEDVEKQINNSLGNLKSRAVIGEVARYCWIKKMMMEIFGYVPMVTV